MAEPTKPRRIRVHAGETWFVVLPLGIACICVEVDEVTRKTVALRQIEDLGSRQALKATRYPRSDVRFVERVP